MNKWKIKSGLILSIYLLSGCSHGSQVDSSSSSKLFENDRVFLDFHLGMTGDEFYSHLDSLKLDFTIATNGVHLNVMRYNLFDNVYGCFSYNRQLDSDHTGFSSVIDGQWRLVRFEVDILTWWDNNGLDHYGSVNGKTRKRFTEIFIAKYGKPNIINDHQLIWLFPEVKDFRYSCELDTIKMELRYQYNPQFLDPYLEREQKNKLEEENRNVNEAIRKVI